MRRAFSVYRSNMAVPPTLGLTSKSMRRWRARLLSSQQRLLTKSGVSDNVGAVKHFLSVLTRALRRARHFALVEDVALPYQPRPARNQFQVRDSVRPMHLFGHTFDHDY